MCIRKYKYVTCSHNYILCYSTVVLHFTRLVLDMTSFMAILCDFALHFRKPLKVKSTKESKVHNVLHKKAKDQKSVNKPNFACTHTIFQFYSFCKLILGVAATKLKCMQL